jgi:putative oxidoreductase
MAVPHWLQKTDERLIGFTRRYSLPALRIALGIIFIWFGFLKLTGTSPVESLVANTIYWMPPSVAIRTLGIVEVIVGAGLIVGWAMRLTLLIFFLQMASTFLVFLIVPDRAFQMRNPLLLTQEGEFVLKNLILIAAGLVIASAMPIAKRKEPLGQMLTEKPRRTPPAE